MDPGGRDKDGEKILRGGIGNSQILGIGKVQKSRMVTQVRVLESGWLMEPPAEKKSTGREAALDTLWHPRDTQVEMSRWQWGMGQA